MGRLSFEKKRVQQPAAHPAVVAVRVFGAGSASVGGASVVVGPGEEIQQAVLDHLQRLAISIGAPVRATIHDDRAGCVVPLEVSADGSSRMTGEPERVDSGEGAARTGGAREMTPVEWPEPASGEDAQAPAARFGAAPVLPVTEAPVLLSSAPHEAAPAVAPATPPASTTPALTPAALAALADEAAAATTHTPPRGFDAMAEEVLGDRPVTETVEGAELLTEPMTRINEAVRAGRIEPAAELADRTVDEAADVLGPRHAEVLHLRELSAYIAYLGGEPARACQLSLDLARLRRQAWDTEAAYGNVQSAATAWRAVRDPEEGLRLGRDLIELWEDLAREPGPAAGDDGRPLESVRARMVRLTDRAARAAQA